MREEKALHFLCRESVVVVRKKNEFSIYKFSACMNFLRTTKIMVS